MTFADRVRERERLPVLFEAVPPDRDAPESAVTQRAERVARLLADRQVDGINIPEIRVEGDDGDRPPGTLTKRDPRTFGRRVTDLMDANPDVVVNHVVAHDPPAAQEAWFETTDREYGIDTVVVVGGGSSAIDYPGPSVSEGVELTHEVLTDPFVGGITIPSRRRDDFDEPDRMLAKQRAGVDFFTSQVVVDPEPVVQLLRDYDAACRDAGVDPATVFLSFAPITGANDVRFLEGLGVDVSTEVREWIVEADTDDEAERRGHRVAERVLDAVLTAVRREDLAVPVGINVGHVMRYNFESSGRLLDRLTALAERHEGEQSAEPVR